MRLPRRLARFNRVVTNRIQGQWAWLLPPWAVICHRGRRSGRAYRTPVIAFTRGRTISVVILYGPESDWVRNLLAGGGSVVRGGRAFELTGPRIVAAQDAGALPALGRAFARFAGQLLVAELGGQVGGFGRGPAARHG